MTTNTHAHPWTLRRLMSMLIAKPSPRRRAAAPWIDSAEYQVNPEMSRERYIAALNGYTPEQWAGLSELVRKDAREHVAWELSTR